MNGRQMDFVCGVLGKDVAADGCHLGGAGTISDHLLEKPERWFPLLTWKLHSWYCWVSAGEWNMTRGKAGEHYGSSNLFWERPWRFFIPLLNRRVLLCVLMFNTSNLQNYFSITFSRWILLPLDVSSQNQQLISSFNAELSWTLGFSVNTLLRLQRSRVWN